MTNEDPMTDEDLKWDCTKDGHYWKYYPFGDQMRPWKCVECNLRDEVGPDRLIVVKIELWPNGNEEAKHTLGVITIANDGTGTSKMGNYRGVASHAGVHFGKRKEPFKTGRVFGFMRKLSPYRLLFRILKSMGET